MRLRPCHDDTYDEDDNDANGEDDDNDSYDDGRMIMKMVLLIVMIL